MMKKIILCLMWLAVVECFYTKQQQRETRAKVRQILSQYEQLSRTSGDASVFTDTMKFEIRTENGETIHLTLHKNNKLSSDDLITEVLIDENKYEEVDFGRDKDYRFYQNLDSGAAIKVKCPKLQKPCSIVGAFMYEDTPYEIQDGVAIDLTDEFDHALFEYPDLNDVDRSGDTVIRPLDEAEKKRILEQDIDNLLLYLDKDDMIHSRATVKNYQIEMHFVVVYDVYDKFMSRLKDNEAVLSVITEYIEQVANEMDMIYALSYKNQDKYNYRFDVVPLKITILKTKDACKWFADNVQTDANNKLSFQDAATLDSFEKWAQANMYDKADAIMYFTGADMKDGESSGTIGLAYSYDGLNALCGRQGYMSIAQIEMGVGLTGSTAAHELVHTFGVKHDEAYGCSEDDQYLMAAKVDISVMTVSKAQNPFKLSSCSMKAIDDNIRTIPVINGKTCLEVHSYNASKYDEILDGPYLGTEYSAKDQCQLAHGAKSDVCTTANTKLEDICWKGIYCKVNGSCDDSKQLQPFLGTPCGTNKVCKLGKCVDY